MMGRTQTMTARNIRRELLDDAEPAEAALNLEDLVRINRFLGGYLVLDALMRNVASRQDSFTVLDVGAASGDMGKAICRKYPKARVTSLDLRANHLEGAPSPKVVADAFRLPFRPRSFDFVFSSLFLHHFQDADVVLLLEQFREAARVAVLGIDLDRGPFGARFIPATRWLFGWHSITLHDAPASVEAAFKREELRALALRAGLQNVCVRVHRPWSRLSLVAGV